MKKLEAMSNDMQHVHRAEVEELQQKHEGNNNVVCPAITPENTTR